LELLLGLFVLGRCFIENVGGAHARPQRLVVVVGRGGWLRWVHRVYLYYVGWAAVDVGAARVLIIKIVDDLCSSRSLGYRAHGRHRVGLPRRKAMPTRRHQVMVLELRRRLRAMNRVKKRAFLSRSLRLLRYYIFVDGGYH
jgi:hypothetical protein